MDANNSNKKGFKRFNHFFLRAFVAAALVHTAVTDALPTVKNYESHHFNAPSSI